MVNLELFREADVLFIYFNLIISALLNVLYIQENFHNI